MNKLSEYLKKIRELPSYVKNTNERISTELLSNGLKNPKVITGRLFAEYNKQRQNIKHIRDAEFQVFSQWGDDGIIQFLIDKIDIPNNTFVEFGVENYTESNTRFLLINNNWSGMVIDGSERNIAYIKNDSISWAFDIHALHAFITRENINELLSQFISKGYEREIGILSIDIDGNDYWIWNDINVVDPVIVIVEYNAVFGTDKAWSIPYEKDFYRLEAHKSYQYWGASLKAFCQLAEEKNYAFIGCNSAGNNAYFVRKDKLGPLKPCGIEEGFIDSKFREYIDENGIRVGGKKRLELIRGQRIINTESGEIEVI